MQPSDVEEYTSIALRVYGGCCANAFSLESLMSQNAGLGSALTFFQLIYIAAQSLPSFILIDSKQFPPRISLKPRGVPLYLWLVCVMLLTGVSLLNNWAFAYRVPVSLQILIRSAGLGVAMCIGYLFSGKRYTRTQVFAVIVVTTGVILATYSRPSVKKTLPTPTVSSPSNMTNAFPTRTAVDQEDASLYLLGVSLLVVSLVLSGVLGTLQERIFATYGPHWRESVFYTHVLSIPFFIALGLLPEVQAGFRKSFLPIYIKDQGIYAPAAQALAILALNLLTQDMCVKGVNRLTTRMSSVSANLVLTGRKAASLCISVWWFDSKGWNRGMTVGAGLVFCGTVLYGLGTSSSTKSAAATSSAASSGVDTKPNPTTNGNGPDKGPLDVANREEDAEDKKNK
ncbi:UAA transporter [Clavulina sp. PMI_390]|nr:UAA transporter [Clavulina sp. PMI_390]